jgi:hypothetical protein
VASAVREIRKYPESFGGVMPHMSRRKQTSEGFRKSRAFIISEESGLSRAGRSNAYEGLIATIREDIAKDVSTQNTLTSFIKNKNTPLATKYQLTQMHAAKELSIEESIKSLKAIHDMAAA